MTPGLSTALRYIYVDNHRRPQDCSQHYWIYMYTTIDDSKIVHSITGYICRQPKMTPGLSTAILDIYVDNHR